MLNSSPLAAKGLSLAVGVEAPVPANKLLPAPNALPVGVPAEPNGFAAAVGVPEAAPKEKAEEVDCCWLPPKILLPRGAGAGADPKSPEEGVVGCGAPPNILPGSVGVVVVDPKIDCEAGAGAPKIDDGCAGAAEPNSEEAAGCSAGAPKIDEVAALLACAGEAGGVAPNTNIPELAATDEG